MQLASHQLTAHLAFRPARRRVRLHRRATAVTVRLTATQLAKRAGAPQDRALYTCGCGFAWTASVSTSIGCPHCGTSQAW
jgi:hypothetical protein